MQTTDVTPQDATTVSSPLELSGLLDLRAFTLLVSSLMVSLATGLMAGICVASQANDENLLVGIIAGFVAGVPAFLATAAGLNSIIRP